MNKRKVTVLIDTCYDVPQTFVEQYYIYVIPLKVVYKGTGCLDGVDITPERVCRGLERGAPKTSLPSGERVTEIFDQVQADDFRKVIAITLPNGPSGTNNMIHLITDQLEDMEVFTMDTKNISVGGGFRAIQAVRYIEDGLSFDEIRAKLMRGINQCKVFFVVKTLEYLQKGGRIDLVASLFGNALNLKPIIFCNGGGIYYVVARVRERKQSITKTRELALGFTQGHKQYNIAIMHGDAQKMTEGIRDYIIKKFPGTDVFIMGQISLVLGVHTGPGILGTCVRILDEA